MTHTEVKFKHETNQVITSAELSTQIHTYIYSYSFSYILRRLRTLLVLVFVINAHSAFGLQAAFSFSRRLICLLLRRLLLLLHCVSAPCFFILTPFLAFYFVAFLVCFCFWFFVLFSPFPFGSLSACIGKSARSSFSSQSFRSLLRLTSSSFLAVVAVSQYNLQIAWLHTLALV